MKDINKTIRHHATPALLEEIDYLIETSRDDGWEVKHDEKSALQEIVDKADWDEWKFLRLPAFRVELALGWWQEVTQEKLAARQQCAGNCSLREAYRKHKGTYYEWAGPSE